ncbi:SAM-dependent methyltransferase [Streptoalloteichus hindustanus]|uniref:Methyltransferase domain-containing protein n=1 Tax=Streptoalloteichus hindustanus TaxID=2017 RepID=A0A1M5LXG4_STRHI|nr:class I SAM-dependent methyltransferase [Streptoalloteichus hindustanus]SHG69705.1 Methyltransferase domain-containing protein [Streptoalloteichus hindustanus]
MARHHDAPTSASPAPLPVDVPAAELLNGFVGTHVLYALTVSGVLDAVVAAGSVSVPTLAEATHSEPTALRALLRAAQRLGLVHGDAGTDTVALTPGGREAYRVRGYFTATVGGFGDVFRHLDTLLAWPEEFGRSVLQNGHYTALGCAQNWDFQRRIFDGATGDLGFGRVADIGCGAAARLIHLVGGRPDVTGVGVDVSGEACQLARQNVKSAGLDDRITIVQADVLGVVGAPEAFTQVTDADLVTSYFILHHFVGERVGGRPFLTALRAAFPRARSFVFADGFRDPRTEPTDDAGPAPLFTLAYQLFHDFTGVGLRTRAEQREMFLDAGYRVERELPFGHPLEWLFVLSPGTDPA